ncbi:MAG: LytR C-terminal domain-containing protein [Candidatus Moraniibacteriota bacterium]|nr:MAG: LytR C-terminal domain-containing protein [Candidatus Moranbacteria bacterium]
MKEVFLAVLVFVALGSGTLLFLEYRREAEKTSDVRPSISEGTLSSIPGSSESVPRLAEEEGDSASDEEGDSPPPPPPGKLEDAETLPVLVLNGGAAGGSAGKMVSYLKTNGYVKAQAGNIDGSHRGTVVYFSSERESEAKALQLILLKQYSGVTAKPAAESSLPEIRSASLSVVMGSQ